MYESKERYGKSWADGAEEERREAREKARVRARRRASRERARAGGGRAK